MIKNKLSTIVSTTLISLALAPIAQAAHHTGAQMSFDHHKPATSSHATLVTGIGNLNSCDSTPNSGSFIRVIVGYHDSITRSLPCAEAAHYAGLRLELVIQWNNTWKPQQIRQRFADTLATYRHVHPFAVAVGNEQELHVTGGRSAQPQEYATDWRMVEPMVRSAFPVAIRVAGETAPWGGHFMAAAAAAGLPGAQAFADHVYPAGSGPAHARDFAKTARAYGVQAWADEGLCGPHAWMRYGCSSAALLKVDGFALAAEWYDRSGMSVAPVITPGQPAPVYTGSN